MHNFDITHTVDQKIQACGPSTGHTVKTVAMCENASIADFLLRCVERHAIAEKMDEAQQWKDAYDRSIDDVAELRKQVAALDSLNKDAHAIIDRVWDIFGRPSYEELAGRTIYDLVNHVVYNERETAAVNDQLVGLLSDRSAENERLKAEIGRLRSALEFYAKLQSRPHPLGPELYGRCLSFHAKAALEGEGK